MDGVKRASRHLLVAMLAIGLSLAVVACGSDSSSDTTGGGGTTAADSGGGGEYDREAFVAEAAERLDAWYAGVDRPLPKSSPKPLKDVNLWVISCGQAAEGCAAGAEGATQAGKALGWDVTVFDGEFNPEKWNAGIRQAIAANADAIAIDDFDCDAVKSALDEARAAGIKIYAWYAFDCDYENSGEAKRFDAEVQYGDDPDIPYDDGIVTFQDYALGYGASAADWMIVKTDGEAKVVVPLHPELKVVKELEDGFIQRIEECESCEIVEELEFTLADLGTTLQQKVQTALNQHPEANAVFGTYDAALQLGIAQAVVASGRNDELWVTGGEGFAANVDLIKENKGQDHFTGSASRWTGWAAVDGINRMLQGEPQVDAGLGWQAGDAENNLPPSGERYDGNEAGAYKDNYLAIWGVG